MRQLVRLLVLVVLAGCSGGAHAVPPAQHAATTTATVRIAIPKPVSATSAGRRPAFVSPNTNGMQIDVYAHSDTARTHLLASAVADLSSSSSVCTAQTDGSRLCSIAIPAPPSAAGDSTDFVFTSYDAAPVSGNIPGGAHSLGTATANATIVAGTSNTIGATLGGIVASATVLPFNLTPTGSGTTSAVLVVALDASGATIIGPDTYASPLTLTSSDATLKLTNTPVGGTATSPSTSVTINEPTDAIAYAYTGDVNNGATAGTITLTVTGTTATPVALSATPSGTITEYGGSLGAPIGITVGPDGNLWFTESASGKIGRITTGGTITEYGGSLHTPSGITLGPDGALWFTEASNGDIGTITTSGNITEYNGSVGEPEGITAGPDGNLWFTDYGNGDVGKITTSGTITEYGSGGLNEPFGITVGPDGNLWVTEQATGTSNGILDMVTTSGAISRYAAVTFRNPSGITTGPDGKLWFPEFAGSGTIDAVSTGLTSVGRFSGLLSDPLNIAVGPDGNLWFTEHGNGKIGKIKTSGVYTEYGGSLSNPNGITAGPDGNVWFTEDGNGKVGKIVP